MPVDILKLPRNLTVSIVYFEKGFSSKFEYLNSVRSGHTPSPLVERAYRAMEPHYAGMFAPYAVQQLPAVTAILMPKSSRADAKPYFDALVLCIQQPLDISDRFTRKGSTKAATAKSIGQVIREFDYHAKGDETSFKSVVIVDETVGVGRTIAAHIYHLCSAGLPCDCEITVVTPYWV